MLSKHFILIFSVCLWLFYCFSAYAGETSDGISSDLTPDNPETFTTWESLKPSATDFDWVQLTSGEWLKGEIDDLYNDQLSIDSEELDLLVIDWEDVKYLKTHIPFTALVEGHGTVYGYFEITSDKLIVTNGDQVREFNRGLVISFISGGEEAKDFWSAKLTFGLNFRSGNTDQVEYNAKANIKRETSLTRFIMDYIGNISVTSNEQTANSHRLDLSHDIFRTRRFFIRPVFAEYFRDPFQNIEYKVTAGAGLGYTLIDTSKMEWLIVAGPGYQVTQFNSVQAGDDDKETTPAMVFGSNYDVELTKWIDYIFDYRLIWVNQKSGGYTHHLINTIEIELTNRFDLDVSFIWDRINNPTREDDGTIPEKDDYRLLIGITFDF